MMYKLNSEYFLRPLQVDDLHGRYTSWFVDQDVTRYSRHGKFPKTTEYFAAYISSINEEKNIAWAICHHVDGHIGNIALQQLNFINRSADFAIMIGEKLHWGKGVGFLAGEKLLFHAFNKLNLKRVSCATAIKNSSMCKLALSLGMSEEGTRRSAFFIDGSWCDLVEFGILNHEFTKA